MIVQHLRSRKVLPTFKFSFLSKLCSLLLLAGLLGIEGVKGQKLAYYSITSVSSVTENSTYRGPAGSSATYSQTHPSAVGQMNAGNSTTLTLSGYAGYKITNIILTMKANYMPNGGAGTLSVVAGSTTISSVSPSAAFSSLASWSNAYSPSFVGIGKNPTAYNILSGENVVITIFATVNSLYINSYQITYVPSAPTVVTTATPSVIATTTATVAGNITSGGSATVTASGIVYALSSINNTPQVGGTGVTNLATSPVKTSGAYSLSASSLALNTQYSFNSYARNSFNTSYGTSSSFYTYAGTPLTPTVNGATTSTLDVAIGSGDGNPSTTSYAIQETGSSNYVQANGSLSATAVWQTASVWGTQTVTGLAANTSYTFQVKARNDAGTPVETGFGLTTTLSTTAISTTGTLTALSTTYGTFTSSTTFTTSGASLTNDIIITPPSGFEVSITAGSGYATSLTLTQSGGTVSSTTIYVRLAATTLFGTYSGNIVVSSTGVPGATIATVSSTVAAKALTITDLSGANKVYNGTTTASVTGTASYNGLVNGETFIVAGTPTFTFNTAAVGSNTITVLGYTAPSSNYTVSQPSLSANITTAALTIMGLTGANKAYNGLTSASFTGTAAYSGLQNGESFTVTGTPAASFATATVGTGKTITVIGYTAPSSNYTVSQPTGLSANITTAALTITGLIGANKTYNGLTNASFTGTAAYSGLQNGESFTVTGTPTASFANATVGTGKTISVSGYTAPSSNYSITQPSLSANITTAALTITGLTGVNKVYTGTTAATTSGTAAYSGLQNGQTFAVTGTPTFTFNTAAVGSRTITASGYTAPSSNYSITQPSLPANITTAALTITGLTGANKTYNGLTSASFTGTAAYSGLQNGQTFVVTGTPVASFATAAVGTGKTITVTGYTAPNSNYTITQPSLSANIIGLVAAIATDYRSQSIGNLSTPATWQFDEGGGSWVTSTIVPIGKNITILNGHAITIDGDYTVVSGKTFTLSTGGSLVVSPTSTLTIVGVAAFAGNPVTLQSTSITNGGAIGTIMGTLTGATNVTVQRYSQPQRGYRTFGHPFNTAQNLGILTDNFRITGLTTNAGSGTYATSAGNPSAFLYDPTQVAGSTSVLTRLTDATANIWGVGKGLYVFVRGAGSQGANGAGASNYSGANPALTAVTIDGTGTINQGNVTVNLGYGSGSTDNYNLIGNPYPCPINLKAVTGMSSFGTVYVYNPVKNVVGGDQYSLSGGFDQYTNNGSNDIIIPSFGAFYVKATAGGQSLMFKESDKAAGGTPTYTVFGIEKQPQLRLTIANSNGVIDELKLGINSSSTDGGTDKYDAGKFGNSLFNFYSIASDKKALAIDYRANFSATTPLGVQTGLVNNYSISLSELTDLPNTEVVLIDKLLKTEKVLSQVGDSYSFDITADTATKGENRFEIGLLGTTVLPVQIADITAQLQTNKTVAVNWTSTTEVNLASYKVQRSKDGSNFTTVGTVAAKGASAYSYSDDLSTVGILPATIYYRLEAVDKDGSKKYSKVVAVALGSSLAKAAINIYPNPVQSTLFAQVTVTKAGAAQLKVVDAQGKIVATQKTQLALGTTSISIPAAQLAVGSYVLEIETTDGKQQQRFVKE